MSRGFTSMFADDLDNLISLKVSLGYSEGTYLGRARQFDRYCSMKYEKAGELCCLTRKMQKSDKQSAKLLTCKMQKRPFKE